VNACIAKATSRTDDSCPLAAPSTIRRANPAQVSFVNNFRAFANGSGFTRCRRADRHSDANNDQETVVACAQSNPECEALRFEVLDIFLKSRFVT
jgi:hypothetical protein|tara:strand:+ start:399 stop:683 length:285 start_codon:yes stop_codon:yes gene_type:complete